MEPVFAICALTLFTWAVAIWATCESDSPDHDAQDPAREEQPQEQPADDGRKAA